MIATLFPLAGAALIGALLVINGHAPVAPASIESVVPAVMPISGQPAAGAAPITPISHQAWIDAISSVPPPCIAPDALPAPLRPVATPNRASKTSRSKE